MVEAELIRELLRIFNNKNSRKATPKPASINDKRNVNIRIKEICNNCG